jgi:NitT/TauT family transport system permease protein
VIIVFLVCFFPIFAQRHPRLHLADRGPRPLLPLAGAGGLRSFWHASLRLVLPQLIVGINGAAVNATVGATIAEWIGGDAGLGYYIQIATGDLRMDLAFAIVIMLAALGLALFGAVVLVEKMLIPWHISQRAPVQGTRG